MIGTFLFLQWRDADAGARANLIVRGRQATGATLVARSDRHALLVSPGTPILEIDGVHIIGHLFTASGATATIADLPSIGSHAGFAATITRTLWGSYVAVLPGGESPAVLQDPSGGIPAHSLEAEGLTLVTDYLTPALARAAGLAITIDHGAVAATLMGTAAATHLPLVTGIRPLIAGRLRTFGDTMRDVAVWSPAVLAGQTEPDPGGALRSAVDLATRALAEGTMVMQLSGGLDSAVVLASLRAAGHQPLAFNYATEATGGDEREQARAVAVYCGTELVTHHDTDFPDFARIADAPQGAAPCVFGLDDLFEHAVDRAAASVGATSIWTGQGGDAVFFQPATPLVAVDRSRALGWRALGSGALVDDARRLGASIWRPLCAVVADHWRNTTIPYTPLAPHLLTSDALAAAARYPDRHPWLAGGAMPPAKTMQTMMLANCQIFHHRRASGRGRLIHPLLTQPVIEAALRIPSYVLAAAISTGLWRAGRLPIACQRRSSSVARKAMRPTITVGQHGPACRFYAIIC